MHDTVVRLVESEDSLGESLNSRAASLAGFCGVILSVLSLSVGASPVPSVSLVFFMIAILALVTTVAFVALGILPTRSLPRISVQELRLYRDASFRSKSPALVQVRSISSLTDRLEAGRENNKRKGRWFNRASWSLALGLFCTGIAVNGGTDIEERDAPPEPPPPPPHPDPGPEPEDD
jgi:hypothetical protein